MNHGKNPKTVQNSLNPILNVVISAVVKVVVSIEGGAVVVIA